VWPVQIADALRALIGAANLAREQGLSAIAGDVRDTLLRRLRDGMLVGMSDTTSHGTRPGERKARLLLEVLRAARATCCASSSRRLGPPVRAVELRRIST
jgi:transposase